MRSGVTYTFAAQEIDAVFVFGEGNVSFEWDIRNVVEADDWVFDRCERNLHLFKKFREIFFGDMGSDVDEEDLRMLLRFGLTSSPSKKLFGFGLRAAQAM